MNYVNGIIVGILNGSAYALIGVSITLMFRSTGVLSLAHAAFAASAAYIYASMAGEHGVNELLAAAVALVITVLYGLVVERLVARPLQQSSPTIKLISTLGVMALTVGLSLLIFGFEPMAAPNLLPDSVLTLGDLGISVLQITTFLVSSGILLGIGVFLFRTRFGLAVRTMAEDVDVARLMGVPVGAVSRFNWALGALIAGVTGILLAPTFGFLTAATFPLLIIRALVATLFGGLSGLGMTFVGGLTIGVGESLTILLTSSPGAQELVLLCIVIALLVLRRTWPVEIGGDQSLMGSDRSLHLPSWLARVVASVRTRLAPLVLPSMLLMSALLVVPPLRSEYWAAVGARALFYVIEALSMVVLVGWGGQVSLMHGAYVGIGAFVCARLVQVDGWPLALAIPTAGLVGMALGALVAIPALRLSGMQFAIASLAFSGAVTEWFLRRTFFTQSFPRGTLFGIDLFSDKNLFLVMLAATAIFYLATWLLRRSMFGTVLLVSRDRPNVIAGAGVSPRIIRMKSFALASFMASVGGAFYGVLLTRFAPTDFTVLMSISLLVYAVVGGIDSLAGPALAGLFFGVLPQVLQQQSTSVSALPDVLAGVALLALVVLRPRGLASIFTRRPAATSVVAESTPPGELAVRVRGLPTGATSVNPSFIDLDMLETRAGSSV